LLVLPYHLSLKMSASAIDHFNVIQDLNDTIIVATRSLQAKFRAKFRTYDIEDLTIAALHSRSNHGGAVSGVALLAKMK